MKPRPILYKLGASFPTVPVWSVSAHRKWSCAVKNGRWQSVTREWKVVETRDQDWRVQRPLISQTRQFPSLRDAALWSYQPKTRTAEMNVAKFVPKCLMHNKPLTKLLGARFRPFRVDLMLPLLSQALYCCLASLTHNITHFSLLASERCVAAT